MARNDRIDLRVSAEEKEQWEQEAQELGLKLSELIRQAIRFYLGHLKQR